MKNLLLITGLVLSFAAQAQKNCFSMRYFGLTVHPFGDQTAKLQPYRLDEKAIVVANFGGFASVDHYIWHDLLAVTAMQAVFTDCSGGLAGFSHIGLRGVVLDRGKHRLLLGFGPLLYYREDWNRFAEYEDGGTFNRYHSRNLGDIQYKIFWPGLEIAWHWRMSEHYDINVGFTPGLPLAMSLSAGVSWWPERLKKEKPVKFLKPKK